MIKAEFLDLGPHNGMKEHDPEGSYRAFTIYDEGEPGDAPQSLTFLVPAHQLPTNHDHAEVIKAAEALAVCICHVLDLDREAGTSSTVHNMARDALDAFYRAMPRREEPSHTNQEVVGPDDPELLEILHGQT